MTGDKAEAVARTLLDQHFGGGRDLLFASDGRFWRYDDKVWSPVSRNVIQRLALETMHTLDDGSWRNKAGLLKQVVTLLLSQTAVDDDRLRFLASPLPVINCANGELWINPDGTVELKPHRAKSYLRQLYQRASSLIYASPVAQAD